MGDQLGTGHLDDAYLRLSVGVGGAEDIEVLLEAQLLSAPHARSIVDLGQLRPDGRARQSGGHTLRSVGAGSHCGTPGIESRHGG